MSRATIPPAQLQAEKMWQMFFIIALHHENWFLHHELGVVFPWLDDIRSVQDIS